jgi:imidazolonepropionase-like amidohydrolase
VVIPGLILISEESPEQSFRFGITTHLRNSDQRAIKISSFPKDGLINTDKLSLYTMVPAKSLNLDQKGIIDIGMIADLIIFDAEKHDILSIKDLKYVIKNGEIVYQNI